MERLAPIFLGKKSASISIDGLSCKLYYRITSSIFIISFLLGISKQYFGEDIICQTDNRHNFVDQYCWSNATFTVNGNIFNIKKSDKNEYQTYYQWVNLLFLFEALCFYFPHFLWKLNMKSKFLALYIKDVALNKEECDALINIMNNKYMSQTYAYYKYICIEILNFMVVVLSFIFFDIFLGKSFSSYGINVLLGQKQNGLDPMERYFPLIAKCTYYLFGPSGDVQVYQVLCLLPLNILYARIFFIIWILFILLLLISIFCLAMHFLMLCSITARRYFSKQYANNIHLWLIFYIAKSNISAYNVNYIKDKGKTDILMEELVIT